MNAKRYIAMAALVTALASGAPAAGETVRIEQLPGPVKQTLEASGQLGPVKEITRSVIAGRTVYTVEIDRKLAPNPHLRIAEDGTLLRDPSAPDVGSSDMPMAVPVNPVPLVPVYPRLKLSDLPAAVQETARQEAGGREIADIDRERWNGRTVYEVEFKERGFNSRVHIAEDGAVVRDERPRRSLKSLFLGTQLEDTPPAVQQTIRRIAGEREIADIDLKGTGADAFYRIEIRSARTTQELRIAQDGRVIYDSHATSAPNRGQ